MKKKPGFTPVFHPLEEITLEGETFRAFFMTEEEIVEFYEGFQALDKQNQLKFVELWECCAVYGDSPVDRGRFLKQYNETIEKKYKESVKKKGRK
jgi:hypothetical protein